MAFRPPWLPVPMTSLITTGSTAAPSWPSAFLSAGEFSKESRIPISPVLSAAKARPLFGFRPTRADPSSGGLRLRHVLRSNLEPLDYERLGKALLRPLRERRQWHHCIHIGSRNGRDLDCVGAEAMHDGRKHRIRGTKGTEKKRSLPRMPLAAFGPDVLDARDVGPGIRGQDDRTERPMQVHAALVAQRQEAGMHLGGDGPRMGALRAIIGPQPGLRETLGQIFNDGKRI